MKNNVMEKMMQGHEREVVCDSNAHNDNVVINDTSEVMDRSTSGEKNLCYNIMDARHSVPRLRTIKSCFNELKKIDPNCDITEWFIRQLCKSNKIDYRLNGNKSLVNFDSLIEYLSVG